VEGVFCAACQRLANEASSDCAGNGAHVPLTVEQPLRATAAYSIVALAYVFIEFLPFFGILAESNVARIINLKDAHMAARQNDLRGG